MKKNRYVIVMIAIIDHECNTDISCRHHVLPPFFRQPQWVRVFVRDWRLRVGFSFVRRRRVEARYWCAKREARWNVYERA